MKKCLNDQIFSIISEVLKEEGVKGFVIGGYVRDCLLNRKSKDIDIVVAGSGIALAKKTARKIGNNTRVNYFESFGTAMLKWHGLEIEFVGARKESYRRNSRKPIVENGSLEDDQLRRDFTINALAISLNEETYGEVVDPFGGIQHLEQKKIVTPTNPDQTFSDDPLRMIRAIRFSSQLDFAIDPVTFAAIRNNKERMEILSMERIADELNKIMLSPLPSKGFKLLEESGLLPFILPELAAMKGIDVVNGRGHKDNFYHTLEVLDNMAQKTDSLWLRWTALLHDIAKPATKKYYPDQGWTFHGHEFLGAKMIPRIFKRLKLPLDQKMKYVARLVKLHLRPIVLAQEEVTDSAIRRLLFDAGDDIDDLMMLCEADITSKNEMRKHRFLQNFQLVREKLKEIEEKDRIRNFQPPVSGEEIMKILDIPPSREVGIIKNAIKDAILDGHINNEYQEAYNFMLEKAAELNLKPQNH